MLTARLTTIARRELDDRTLDPGDAHDLLDLIEAARAVLDYEHRPSRSSLSALREALTAIEGNDPDV